MHHLLKSLYIRRVSSETRRMRDCDTCFMIMAHGELNIKVEIYIRFTFWYLMFLVSVRVDHTGLISCDNVGNNHPVMLLQFKKHFVNMQM